MDAFSVDFAEEKSKVVLHAFERLLNKEKEEVVAQLQGIAEKALKQGMATLGLNGTLEALNKGQVYTLYLLTSFSPRGEKCLQCGSLNVIHPSGNLSVPCPRCKGETKRIDLAEEMMKLTLRQDGEVKWAEENLILKENDGVGAALRFR